MRSPCSCVSSTTLRAHSSPTPVTPALPHAPCAHEQHGLPPPATSSRTISALPAMARPAWRIISTPHSALRVLNTIVDGRTKIMNALTSIRGACIPAFPSLQESPWAATLLARQASYYSLTLDEFQATFAGASHQRRLAPSGSPRSRRCSPPRKPLGAQIRVRVTGLLCAFSLRRQNSSAAITRVAGSAGSAGRGFTGVAGGAEGSNGSAGSDGTRPSSGGIAMGVGMGGGMGGGVGGGVGMGGGMVPTVYGVGAGMGAGMVASMGAGMVAGMGAGGLWGLAGAGMVAADEVGGGGERWGGHSVPFRADLVLPCAGPSSQNRTAPFWKLPSAPRWAPCLSGVFLLSPLPHLHCAPHTLHHRSPALPVTCPLRYRHRASLPDAVKKLARRLLFDKSASDNHERSILTKLKQQCGGHFTSKMEGMVRVSLNAHTHICTPLPLHSCCLSFALLTHTAIRVTDLTLAPEQQAAFEEYLADSPGHSPGIDLSVTVLTTVFWPSYKSSDLALPAEMVRCVEVFKEFYQTKTKHRKLMCIYSQGTCNITGKFTAKPIELIVTTYQAAVLLLFNASERLTDEDIVRLLHSLSCDKYKILVKKPAGKTIEQSDVFAFNPSFTDKMRRIKVCALPACLVYFARPSRVCLTVECRLGVAALVMAQLPAAMPQASHNSLPDPWRVRCHAVFCGGVCVETSRCHCRHRRVHCAHHEEPQGAGPPAARARMRRATRPHVQGNAPPSSHTLPACASRLLSLLSCKFSAKVTGHKAIKKRTEDLIARENLQRDKENPTNFRYLA
ncbi:unnamed protein product [Closterium sp. Naga37s-1]|nr:unnamed protein product [Closterium sp. Naga37s-1]